MKLNVINETAPLESVVLGIGLDRGKPRSINPMMRWHIKNGTFPNDETVSREIRQVELTFQAAGIEVIRPENLKDVSQIFTRDIGFVIDQTFVRANMAKTERQTEIEALGFLMEQLGAENVLTIPEEAIIEGGDVILLNEHIFIGLGTRTNQAGVDFIAEKFPHKKVVGLPIVVDEDDYNRNILHLDCAFQPIGTDEAILFEDGFVDPPKEIFELYPEDKLLRVNEAEKNAMFPNVFSLGPKRIIIEKGFDRLKEELLKRSFEIYEVPYSEVAKLGGLLRCSTLPLRRS